MYKCKKTKILNYKQKYFALKFLAFDRNLMLVFLLFIQNFTLYCIDLKF